MGATSPSWPRAIAPPLPAVEEGPASTPVAAVLREGATVRAHWALPFNDLPQVQSGEWEPCLATRARAGWCAGHAAQWYEKRPLKPLRRRRTGCDFPGCSNRHNCRGYCAAHYQQLRQGKPLTPLNLRKGWFRASNGYVYIWEPDHPTPTSKDMWRSMQKSWLRYWGGLCCQKRRCITVTGRGTIIVRKS